MSSIDSNPHLDEQGKAEVAAIWKFLKRPQDAPDAWPCLCIARIKDELTPPNPDAGPIPDCLVNALEIDIRTFPDALERSEHFAFYIGRSQVEAMTEFWKSALHRILCCYAQCSRPRTRNGLTVLILDNLFGIHASENQISRTSPPRTREDAEGDPSTDAAHSDQRDTRQQHPMDLTQSIRVMTSIFGPADRLTGEENEPFLYRLQPMLDQMQASQIPDQYQVTTLFSLLTGKAKLVASKIRSNTLNITEFVDEIAGALVFEQNIQQRKANRWKALTFSEFRANSRTHHEAIQSCIEHMTAHQKDLTPHNRSNHYLLARFREVFEFEEWCTTLYEQDLPTMSSSSFAQRLLTAASRTRSKRFDSRQNRPPTSTSSYHTSAHTPQPKPPESSCATTLPLMVAAFFAKTPPPPRHRRPHRYRYSRRRFPYQNPHRRNWQNRMPSSLRNRLPRTCYGCKQPGHILRDCPEKHKYIGRLRRLHEIGSGAHLILSDCDRDPSDDMDEMVHFLEDSLDDIIDPSIDTETDYSDFDTWLSDLLDIVDDNHATEPLPATNTFHTSQPQHSPLDSRAFKFSVDELQKAIHELQSMVNHATSIPHHLLLDPGAPRSICIEPWLQQSNWHPIKRIPLPPDMRPFRFAGHPIHAMYAVCLIAELTDSSGNVHLFRQVTFVLPSTPIPFLVGLQIQRTLSFDLCLRSNTDSHLKINAWNSIHQLMVNSHVWLPFRPVNTEVDRDFDWDHLIKNAFRIPACDDTSSHIGFPVFCTNTPTPTYPARSTSFDRGSATNGVQSSPEKIWTTSTKSYATHKLHQCSTSSANRVKDERFRDKYGNTLKSNKRNVAPAPNTLNYLVYPNLPSRLHQVQT